MKCNPGTRPAGARGHEPRRLAGFSTRFLKNAGCVKASALPKYNPHCNFSPSWRSTQTKIDTWPMYPYAVAALVTF